MGKKSKKIIPADYKPGGLAEPDDPPEKESLGKRSTGITIVEGKVSLEKTMGLPFFPKHKNNPPANAQEKLC
jgi:hypothetical protein